MYEQWHFVFIYDVIIYPCSNPMLICIISVCKIDIGVGLPVYWTLHIWMSNVQRPIACQIRLLFPSHNSEEIIQHIWYTPSIMRIAHALFCFVVLCLAKTLLCLLVGFLLGAMCFSSINTSLSIISKLFEMTIVLGYLYDRQTYIYMIPFQTFVAITHFANDHSYEIQWLRFHAVRYCSMLHLSQKSQRYDKIWTIKRLSPCSKYSFTPWNILWHWHLNQLVYRNNFNLTSLLLTVIDLCVNRVCVRICAQ